MFRQQQKKCEQETSFKTLQKLPGGLTNVTYELRQELKAETNPAGYKTKPIRQAIEAGVVGTGKYLEGMKDNARLAAAERKAKLFEDSLREVATLMILLQDELNSTSATVMEA